MGGELHTQEPLLPLQLLALALLEDSQDPLTPLVRQREVPLCQLHHQQVLVVQWDSVAPVGLPGLPMHLVPGLPVKWIYGQNLQKLLYIVKTFHLVIRNKRQFA